VNRHEINVTQDITAHKQGIKSTLLVFFMLAILFVYTPLTKRDLKDSIGQSGKVRGPTLFFQGSQPSSGETVATAAPVIESHLDPLKENSCRIIQTGQLANDTPDKGDYLPAISIMAISAVVDAPDSTDILPLAIPDAMPASLLHAPSPTSNVANGTAPEGIRKTIETGYFSLQGDIERNSHFNKEETELSLSSAANCKEHSGQSTQLYGHTCLKIN